MTNFINQMFFTSSSSITNRVFGVLLLVYVIGIIVSTLLRGEDQYEDFVEKVMDKLKKAPNTPTNATNFLSLLKDIIELEKESNKTYLSKDDYEKFKKYLLAAGIASKDIPKRKRNLAKSVFSKIKKSFKSLFNFFSMLFFGFLLIFINPSFFGILRGLFFVIICIIISLIFSRFSKDC